MPAQRQFAPPQRPPMRAHRPSPQARRSATASDRPSERGHVSWFGLGAAFGLKLIITAVAGAMVTVLLWPESREPAVPSQPDRQETAADAHRAETIVYRRMPQGHSGPAWETQSVETWSDQPPPSNYPRRVKTVKFTPPGQEATAAIPPTASLPRSAAFPSIRPALVKSWRYQLQNVNPDEIAKSPSDLVVIDYSGEDGPFSKAQVERMQQKPDGSRRIVLSYMSIGEAESYRWYWPQRSSSWLGPENAKWKGNYGVRFWDPAWQEIIFDYTNRILAAGFDGVYLDKVDEFEEMGHRDEMVEFVSRIAARAKSQRPDFLVISQNGDGLLADTKFRRALDGFAREDLLYGEDSDGKRNSRSSIRESVKRLKMVAAEGKPVLVVEYPRNDNQARTARREISAAGFVGLIARRALDAP